MPPTDLLTQAAKARWGYCFADGTPTQRCGQVHSGGVQKQKKKSLNIWSGLIEEEEELGWPEHSKVSQSVKEWLTKFSSVPKQVLQGFHSNWKMIGFKALRKSVQIYITHYNCYCKALYTKEREPTGHCASATAIIPLFISRINQTSCYHSTLQQRCVCVCGLWSLVLNSQRKPSRLFVFLLWDSKVRW